MSFRLLKHESASSQHKKPMTKPAASAPTMKSPKAEKETTPDVRVNDAKRVHKGLGGRPVYLGNR